MEIPIAIRDLIVQLRKEGASLRKIAQIVKKSHSTVQYICQRYDETKSNQDRQRTGRPQKLESHHKRAILRTIRSDPRTSAPKLTTMLETDYNVKVVPETIRNVIRKAGYNGRTARRKPFISSVNKRKRLEFANLHINKDETFWNNVIFSDECKFTIFNSDGNNKVWRKPNTQMETKYLYPTFKHGGGGVMVWGCMSAAGVGSLIFIDGIMDQHVYLKILKENLVCSAAKLNLEGSFIFQQDNDPKHTARKVKEWLLYNVPKQLHTPPQSPDVNPIEHLWSEIKRRLKKHNIKNKEDLKCTILLEWNNIQAGLTKKLVGTMPKRLQEIIKLKGGSTDH